MPSADEVEASVGDTVAAIDAAQRDLLEMQVTVLGLVIAGRFRRRDQTSFAGQVDAIAERVTAAAALWLTGVLPGVYADGARQVTVDVVFGQAHRAAVQALADETWDQILQATRYMTDDAKRWLRDMGRVGAGSVVQRGVPIGEAVRALAELAPRAVTAAGTPVDVAAVVYRNGARHTIADYADMLLRTQTTRAYNAGTLNTAEAVGIGTVRLLDGADCGLTSHDDPTKAHNLVVDIATARRYPLAHARCRRSIAVTVDPTGPLPGTTVTDPASSPGRAARQPRTSRAARRSG